MKLGTSLLGKLAQMICGDSLYNNLFPYRSSSYLTRFFEDLDLDYAHDGSTRDHWVRSVLIELNNISEKNFPFPDEIYLENNEFRTANISPILRLIKDQNNDENTHEYCLAGDSGRR